MTRVKARQSDGLLSGDKGRRTGPHLDLDAIARVVVDSNEMGDRLAAKRNGVSARSVSRYRERSRIEPELAELVRKKTERVELGWHAARNALLRRGMAKLSDMIERATQDQMAEVITAIQMVGNLEITLASIPQPHAGRDPAAAEDPGSEPAEADEDDGQGHDDASASSPDAMG